MVLVRGGAPASGDFFSEHSFSDLDAGSTVCAPRPRASQKSMYEFVHGLPLCRVSLAA
jgi:hypothetical protein